MVLQQVKVVNVRDLKAKSETKEKFYSRVIKKSVVSVSCESYSAVCAIVCASETKVCSYLPMNRQQQRAYLYLSTAYL